MVNSYDINNLIDSLTANNLHEQGFMQEWDKAYCLNINYYDSIIIVSLFK